MAKYQHLLAFGIVSWCLAAEDESSCTNRLDLLDVSFFMQVKQNSTVQTVPAQHNRTWPSMLLDNMNRAWAGQQMPLSPRAQSSSESSGTALLDIIIIVVMIGSQTGGIVLLNVVTMLFGSNQVLVKILETDDATHAMDSFLCMGLRFGVGALALRALMLTKRKDKAR
ncbi:unnamed protein product [Effrenium voratum]|nr:unnamed protein product [Effrenium voratum]